MTVNRSGTALLVKSFADIFGGIPNCSSATSNAYDITIQTLRKTGKYVSCKFFTSSRIKTLSRTYISTRYPNFEVRSSKKFERLHQNRCHLRFAIKQNGTRKTFKFSVRGHFCVTSYMRQKSVKLYVVCNNNHHQ